MALVLLDRVKETTSVVGTGTASLLGAAVGFQTFSTIGDGNTTFYTISDQSGSNWEVGIGVYAASGNTLARTTVLASSNAGSLVTFTAGTKDIFITYPAEQGIWADASNNVGIGAPSTGSKLLVSGIIESTTGGIKYPDATIQTTASKNTFEQTFLLMGA